MIWRIIGTIGGISFLGTGLAALTDPECVSANFGGGRVVELTCRSDNYGSMSGTSAGLMSVFGGVIILSLIWAHKINKYFHNESRQFLERNSAEIRMARKVCEYCGNQVPQNFGHCPKCMGTKFSSEAQNGQKADINALKIGSLSSNQRDVKICDKCKRAVPILKSFCTSCSGTSFTQKKIGTREHPATSEELMLQAFEAPMNVSLNEPDYKICPMCAEDIKFAAKKCRYCGSMV